MLRTILVSFLMVCAGWAESLERIPGYQPMEPVSTLAPAYPKAAAAQRAGGEVVLTARIGADGSVKRVQVVSGPPVFHYAAVLAVSRWRYRPAMLHGTPVAGEATIRLTFRMQ